MFAESSFPVHSRPLIAPYVSEVTSVSLGALKALLLNVELGPWLNVLMKILPAKITTWIARMFMCEFEHDGCKCSDQSGSIHNIKAPDIPHPGEAARYIWEHFRVLGTWETLHFSSFCMPVSSSTQDDDHLEPSLRNKISANNKTNKQQNHSLPASLLRWQHGEKFVRISITRLPTLPSNG